MLPRSVLVTGATSGIGLATALHLARLGFHVVGSARTPGAAGELAQRAADAGVDLEVVVLDLHDPRAGEDVVPGLRLWGLVNNAGYLNPGAVEDVPADDARRQLEAMVVAPARLAQLALPGMRDRRDGRIVTISSSLAHASWPLVGWYEAAKRAVSAVSEALRAEVAGFGVDVVLVEPGGHRTAIWQRAERDLIARRDSSPYGPAYERLLALFRALEPRVQPPERVARAVGEALTAVRPRDRYRVGADGLALELAESVVPAAVRERALRAVLRL